MASKEPSVHGLKERDSSPDFGELRARAKRQRLFVVGGVLVIGVTAAVAALVSQQRAQRRELEAAVSELQACLLGGALAAPETPALRFRRLQLRALSQSDAARAAAANKLWPFSCRAPAGRVSDLLKDSASDADRKSLSDLVALLADGTAISKDASAVLSAVMPVLDATHAAPAEPAAEPLPPSAENTDTLTKLVGLSQKGLSRTFTEDNPGLTLPVLMDDESAKAPLFCTFTAASPEADCRVLSELTSVHGNGLRLLGTSEPGGPNLVFAGKRGSEGVFVTGNAQAVDRMYSYGGFASKDGLVSVLGYDEEKRGMRLTQRRADGSVVRTALNPNFRVGNYFYSSQLLWDQILVRGVTPEEERRLFVMPLSQENKDSFGLVDIGELPEPGLIRPGEEEQPHLTGCRTGEATVVRVRGRNSDYLTFRINGGFTAPVQASATGVLGCYGTVATIVSVVHRGSGTLLAHDLCTTAGCTRTVLQSEALDGNASDLRPHDPEDVAAVDLDGQLLAVWRAGERGGLRLRMGAPDKFAHAADVVVFDDRVAENKLVRDSTLLGFKLYSREHFALLLLSTMAGVHAFRVDPSGAIKPWTLKMRE